MQQATLLTNLPYLLLLFARGGAFFLFSPLFINRGISLLTRILLATLLALILLPKLIQNELIGLSVETLWFWIIKEFALGYLIGLLFAFMVEAALLTGNWFATITGFSATELLDPLKNSQPLFSRFFILLTVGLILTSDMHHIFIYSLFDTFTFIPIEGASLSSDSLLTLSKSAIFIFNQSFSYIFIPLFLLLIVTLFMALLSKFNPELPIFWLGFPIQIFVGFFSLALLLLFIAPLIEKGFMEILNIAERYTH